MTNACFVGFDTSNYTTSIAVSDGEGHILANLKRPLPVEEGACGLRQSDAVFSHVRNLPPLMEEARAFLEGRTVRGVGCSVRPRSVEGSYMPCFLAGRAAAASFAAAACAPLVEVSHQDGHLMAALYSSGEGVRLRQAPFAAFHVSGGTTEVLHVLPHENGTGFSVREIGGTADLNAGQAIDRVGVMMGMSFPCGRALETSAEAYKGKLPRPRISVKGCTCNLSGLENLAGKLWKETKDRPLVSAYVLSFVGATLRAMTEGVDEQLGHLPILYAGGVMSNRYLQTLLGARKDTYFAEPQFSADNAAGVALLARLRLMNEG